MSDAQWHYARQGQQAGPVSTAVLQGMARSGQLAREDLVWRDGMPNWQPAGTVAELFGDAGAPYPTAASQQPGYGQPQQYGGQPYPGQQYPAQPGYYAPPQQAVPVGYGRASDIPNYLVQSILVTIFCCWPFGIPAIVYAAQVNGKAISGDYQGAIDASNKAKMWCWWSFGSGLAIGVLYFVLIAVAGINA